MQSQSSLVRIDTAIGAVGVTRSGGGLPVLFWPSVFMPSDMFSPVISALGADIDAILIDPPGQGESAPLNRTITLSECADAIADIAAALKLDQVVLVGNSWGGMVAIALAEKYPDLCRGVALMNTSARPATLWDKIYYGSLVPILRLAGFFGPFPAMAVRSFLGKTSRKTRNDLIDLIKQRLGEIDRRSAANTALSILIGRASQVDKLSSVQCPAIVIGGDEDGIFPPDHSRQLADGIPSAELIMLQNIGHFAPLEAPTAMAAYLDPFLQGLQAEPYRGESSDPRRMQTKQIGEAS
ncbi:MAG: alpha/beta hydrolase [Pseudomonadota bacterium]